MTIDITDYNSYRNAGLKPWDTFCTAMLIILCVGAVMLLACGIMIWRKDGRAFLKANAEPLKTSQEVLLFLAIMVFCFGSIGTVSHFTDPKYEPVPLSSYLNDAMSTTSHPTLGNFDCPTMPVPSSNGKARWTDRQLAVQYECTWTVDGRPQHGRIRIIPNGRFQGHNAQLFNTDGGTYCPNTWRNGSECVPVSGKDSRP